MLKTSKVLLSVGLSFSLISTFSLNSVDAESNSQPGDGARACTEVGTYTTTYSSKTTSKKTEFTHNASNGSSTPDSVTRSVAITHAATVSLGAETEFNALVTGAKISANVGYGYNNTKTLSTTWSVPKGNWKLTAGSSWVKSNGTRYKVVAPCNLTNGTALSANYTSATWSDKTEN